MAMLEVKSVLNLLGTPVSYAYAVTAGPWIGVTQQRLDNSNIGTTLEKVGREAVAQRVQRHGLFDPRRLGRLVKQAAQLAGGHRLAALVAGKQPAFGHGCSSIVSRWARLPPLAQQTERLRRQHDIAVLAALSLIHI